MTDTAVISTAPTVKSSTFAAALNDSNRGRVGNPRRGSYHLSVLVADDQEQEVLVSELDQLDVAHQINTRRRDGQKYIAVYSLEALRAMLEQIGPQLTSERHDALELLVRARSPIPEEIVDAIWRRYQLDRWDEEQIVTAMVEKGIIDGMGKGWTPRKIRRILAEM